MLQQSAHKSVMHALRCGMKLEPFFKILILDKKALQKLS